MKKGMAFKDITGLKFGKLLVLGISGKKRRCFLWDCECDCGNITKATTNNLTSGHKQSCGCLRVTNPQHGLYGHVEHGYREHPLESCYRNMMARCYVSTLPGYENYGGRGIIVCDSWKHSFKQFLIDVGPKPGKEYSLDRINTNGNYEPGNVRWSTETEQQRNRTNNRYITYNGTTLTAVGWSEKFHMKRWYVSRKLYDGWSMEKIEQHAKNKNKVY